MAKAKKKAQKARSARPKAAEPLQQAAADEFPIKGWKWIFYIIGWITGALNLLFWLIMILAYLIYNPKDPLFNNAFHRRVYIWGLVVSILFGIFLVLGILFILFLASMFRVA